MPTLMHAAACLQPAVRPHASVQGVYEFVDKEHDEHEGMDEAAIRDHEEVTKVKNINRIHLGRHVIEAWYFTPYPQEFWKVGTASAASSLLWTLERHPRLLAQGGVTDTLYLDEFTLKFFLTKEELVAFRRKCTLMHPPGDELYRHDGIAMFEVDGAVQKEYCQNLSYVAKMFLDHKTLYYDVDPFLFYIMCEVDEFGYHIVGYYSKEKYSEAGELLRALERAAGVRQRRRPFARCSHRLQLGLYLDAAALPAQGVRQVPHPVLLRAE